MEAVERRKTSVCTADSVVLVTSCLADSLTSVVFQSLLRLSHTYAKTETTVHILGVIAAKRLWCEKMTDFVPVL